MQSHHDACFVERWLAGKEDGMRGQTSIRAAIRRWLFARAKDACEHPGCGWGTRNTFTGNIPLEVHHADGDHRNNRPENLQILCPNHHSLTQNFRACNIGKGRPRKA